MSWGSCRYWCCLAYCWGWGGIFCLLSCVPKISCSPVSFGYCSYSRTSHLLFIWHFQWLLEVSKPGLLQLCRRATAQPCAGAFRRVCVGSVPAGSSLLGAESGLDWWLQSALNREAWTCFVLFRGVQMNVVILVISEWWLVEQLYKQTVGLKWQGRTGFLPGRKDVLLGEAAETHFAPVLCCGPSCKWPRLFSPSSPLLNGLWSSHSPLSIGSCWLQRENTRPPHYP